ncbi:MAG: hypothetical protein AAF950_16965 [Pseudomonadota bacterium]
MANCYFREGKILNRLMRSSATSLAYSLIVSFIMTIFLFISVSSFAIIQLVVLLFSSLSALWVYVSLRRWLVNKAGAVGSMADTVCRSWSVRIVTLITAVAILLISLFLPPPEYALGVKDFTSAVDHARQVKWSACGEIDDLLSFERAMQNTRYLLAQSGIDSIDRLDGASSSHLGRAFHELTKLAIWIVFLSGGYLAVLGYVHVAMSAVAFLVCELGVEW